MKKGSIVIDELSKVGVCGRNRRIELRIMLFVAHRCTELGQVLKSFRELRDKTFLVIRELRKHECERCSRHGFFESITAMFFAGPCRKFVQGFCCGTRAWNRVDVGHKVSLRCYTQFSIQEGQRL